MSTQIRPPASHGGLVIDIIAFVFSREYCPAGTVVNTHFIVTVSKNNPLIADYFAIKKK